MRLLRCVHLEPQTGTALIVKQGEWLEVIDPEGEQVSDLISFALDQSQRVAVFGPHD